MKNGKKKKNLTFEWDTLTIGGNDKQKQKKSNSVEKIAMIAHLQSS